MASDHHDIQVMAAQIVVDEHVRICVPEVVCWGCLRPWPCIALQACEVHAFIGGRCEHCRRMCPCEAIERAEATIG